jgi:hypothetical protein
VIDNVSPSTLKNRACWVSTPSGVLRHMYISDVLAIAVDTVIARVGHHHLEETGPSASYFGGGLSDRVMIANMRPLPQWMR